MTNVPKGEKYGHDDIEIWNLDDIRGAEYNPRVAHEDRLNDLEQSLLTLGFVLPLYVTPDGLLLSGHQRSKTARKIGYTKVPVVVRQPPKEFEKGVNILFNTATNDLGTRRAKDVYNDLRETTESMAFEGEHVPVDTFPCLSFKKEPLMKYADYCLQFSTDPALVNGGKQLIHSKFYMPLVVCGDRVINGVCRWFGMYSGNFTHVDVVEIPEEHADYAYMVLNLLSMDFNLQEDMKEELRFNAFRRPAINNYIVGLSRGWTYPVYRRTVRNSVSQDGKVHADLNLIPHKSRKVLKQYRDTYGDYIVDFGAGTLDDANTINQSDLTVFPFEPYHCTGKTNDTELGGEVIPDSDLSRKRCKEWIDALKLHHESGKRITSVVSSYMMNSIPHHKDRMACLAIIAALCTKDTNVHICGTGITTFKSRSKNFVDPSMETNMTLGKSLKAFKVQKYFYPEELKKMLEVFFISVECVQVGGVCYAHAKYPRRPNAAILREALEIEFNLPYSDDTTMDLVDEAKELFSLITGLKL